MMKNNNNEEMFLIGMSCTMLALMGFMVIALFPSWWTVVTIMVAVGVAGKSFEKHYNIDLNDFFEAEEEL